jgi:hypothetical protein
MGKMAAFLCTPRNPCIPTQGENMMETKVIRIEIRFTQATLAAALGVLVLLGALLALLWATGTVVAGPSADDGAQPEGVLGVAAIVGGQINYQGRLEGATGPVEMTFRLWKDATSTDPGDVLWEETKTVTPVDGLFHTQLGDTTALGQYIFNGRELWLGVEAGTDAEMTPRQEILPVPYAMSLRPGAEIRDDSEGHTLEVWNGQPAGMALTKKAVAAYTSDGIAVLGSANSGTGIFGRSATGRAGDFDGDVAQNLAGNGLVKAGVYLLCDSPGATRYRYFNNVTDDEITVRDQQIGGQCIIDLGFDVSERFWVAMPTTPSGNPVTCHDAGSDNTELWCYLFGSNHKIMVLVY